MADDLSISADGYSAGPNQTEERPFGDDGGDGWGDKLHAWMFETPEEDRAGGGANVQAAARPEVVAPGAFVMGRNMFGGGATTANQYLAAGLIDVLQLHIVR